MTLETIIGLEIHIQQKTKSKMFCSCSNEGEYKDPNTTICPVCLGHPGVLPVANQQAIDWSIKTALALNCKIDEYSKFDRKHYFYPDLPKGYQISQFDQPIGKDGFLEIIVNGEKKKFRINRLHLEEDAAKLTHVSNYSLVDYNRGGTPLMEIVTEADFRTPADAKAFLQELRLIARYLDVSSADMEMGHLRCDANISLRPKGDEKLYPKTEIKNLNSFKAVERALEYEIKRQTKLWEEKTPPKDQATRGWNENELKTVEQRTKEEAHDYRYFPEPDIPPLHFTKEKIREIQTHIPELPFQKRERMMKEYEISYENAKILSEDKKHAEYFEHVVSELLGWLESLPESEGSAEEIWAKNKKKLSKLVSDWFINKLSDLMTKNKIEFENLKITPENFAEFITLIYSNKINSSAAQTIITEMLLTGKDPSDIMDTKGLAQMESEEELETIVDEIIQKNPSQVEQFKAGKEALLQFFIGKVMAQTKGKANPQTTAKILKDKIK